MLGQLQSLSGSSAGMGQPQLGAQADGAAPGVQPSRHTLINACLHMQRHTYTKHACKHTHKRARTRVHA
jgi:hypothetical protein